MEISISSLWAVAYMNNLSNRIDVYSRLFSNREEAEAYAKEYCKEGYSVNLVFFRSEW